MFNLKPIKILLIFSFFLPTQGNALTTLTVPDIEIRVIAAAADIIDGQVIELAKSPRELSCASFFAKIKVSSSIKRYFKEEDVVEIFLVSNPRSLSVGDSVLIAPTDKDYLRSSKCSKDELNALSSPRTTFTDSFPNISLAKSISGTDLVKFETCESGEFFYAEHFIKNGYKIEWHNRNRKRCKSLTVPKAELLRLINSDWVLIKP